MTQLDREILAEKIAAVERHLLRVAKRLPADPASLRPSTDAADSVILHLWQAVQIIIDLALSTCLNLKLGTPASYADSFRSLAQAGYLDRELADRLTKAAGFRNLVVHTYENLDMRRIHEAAVNGPADLRSFLQALGKLVS
ncbi:MAG TPA: DUF86 domain-containing protein [Myxococcota bacterium]|nr:DUF86 domain-containing protein [Myxococcota bacterium]